MQILWSHNAPVALSDLIQILGEHKGWKAPTVKALVRNLRIKGAIQLTTRGHYAAVMWDHMLRTLPRFLSITEPFRCGTGRDDVIKKQDRIGKKGKTASPGCPALQKNMLLIHIGTAECPRRRHSKASFAPHRGKQTRFGAGRHTFRSLRAGTSPCSSASIPESSPRSDHP